MKSDETNHLVYLHECLKDTNILFQSDAEKLVNAFIISRLDRHYQITVNAC